MSFTSWAVTLNGVTVAAECDHIPDMDCVTDDTVIEGLDGPPDGLGLPGLRTEDTTFAQRDGVRHFNDWYLPRILTMTGLIGPDVPDEDCESCTTVRQQLSELMSAWRRSCCDIEMVIHTPCDGKTDDGDIVPGPPEMRVNLVTNPSFESSLIHWSDATDADFTYTRETSGGWVGTSFQRMKALTTAPWQSFQFPDAFNAETFAVTAGLPYTFSGYVRTDLAAGVNVDTKVLFYDADGLFISSDSNVLAVPTGDVWTRLSNVNVVAPANATSARLQFFPSGAAVVNKHVDLDGVLIEQSDTLGTYFDGSTADSDNPVDGGEKITHAWGAATNNTISYEQIVTYELTENRDLYGPFGVVGRPRVATYKWDNRVEQIARFILRFDATDQRMYVLDECGTPGYQKCYPITPGTEVRCRSYPRCYTGSGGSGRCYDETSLSHSVLPVSVPLEGTERVNPLIVLFPNLTYPMVENMDTGEYVQFDGIVANEPIEIYTETGTAKGQISGLTYTHLLSGSIFLSMIPGVTEFRMISRSTSDTGSATICFRPAVLVG